MRGRVLKRVDVAGAEAHRRMLGELPAREAAEVPVARRRQRAAERLEAFRQMLEPGDREVDR